MVHTEIAKLKTAIAPYREALLEHPLYNSLQSLEDVKAFMEVHVHAVWDFMVKMRQV